MVDITETISEEEARARVESRRAGATTPEGQAELAEALLALSYALSRKGATAEAFDAAGEAVRTLSPVFLANPAVYADAMNGMVAEYLGMSQHSHRKPDMALIKPLAVPLGRYEHRDDNEE